MSDVTSVLDRLHRQIASSSPQLSNVLMRSTRRIAYIVPDVVMEESANDVLVVTEHPVETGSPISDHAYKKPAELTMRVGWSNSNDGYGGPAANDRVQQIYADLRTLQVSMEPFNITTGKHTYKNMMLTGISVNTDASSEYALLVTAQFREVILVQTEAVSMGQDDVQQTEPQQTAEPVAQGTQQTKPEDISMFARGEDQATGHPEWTDWGATIGGRFGTNPPAQPQGTTLRAALDHPVNPARSDAFDRARRSNLQAQLAMAGRAGRRLDHGHR